MIYCMSRFSLKPSGCVCDRLIRNQSNVKADFYAKDFMTLGLKSTADQESVRKAFIALCKRFHPDSGGPEADADKFQQIEKAYRSLQTKFTQERWDVPDLVKDVTEFDIKHTAPQHREYLSYDGIGSGTPSQRQQQYMQTRAANAAQRVLEHKLSGLQHTGNALTVQDRQRVEKTKTRFGMDRLVEDLIQESMARGDFQNLAGAGKPLNRQIYNPHVDFVTHKMNEIMIENGFTPEWITVRREIEEDSSQLRHSITKACCHHGNASEWSEVKKGLETSARSLNKKIQFFNLIVPIMNHQLLLFRLDLEIEKALKMPREERKGKKKKNKVARSQLPVPFIGSLCYAALKTLDVLFNSLGFTLTPEIHKDVQLIAIEILLSVKKHGTSTPLYGESPRCRAALYQVLLQLCLEPCSRWPPPTQFALRLLGFGRDDASPQVASVCSTALTMIDRIIHPEFSLAAFPLDYAETVKEMKRWQEMETESEKTSPVIVEDCEAEIAEQLNHSSPRDLPSKPSESDDIEIIIEDEHLKNVSTDSETAAINGNSVQETAKILENGGRVEETCTLRTSVGLGLETSPKKSVPSSADPSEKDRCNTVSVDCHLPGAEKSGRKGAVHSSDSESSGTPVKRRFSEHSYNLRPKTPRPVVDSSALGVSKFRRLDMDSASPRSSQKSADSNDTDDVTLLFDETIIN